MIEPFLYSGSRLESFAWVISFNPPNNPGNRYSYLPEKPEAPAG